MPETIVLESPNTILAEAELDDAKATVKQTAEGTLWNASGVWGRQSFNR